MLKSENAIELRTAASSAICETWGDLADSVEGLWQGAVEHSNSALYGSLAVGARIVMFAERPEVQAEAEKACARKRGPHFTPFGFVSVQLAQRFGERLPSARQLQRCSRAALIARERGIIGGSIEGLLGWRQSGFPAFVDGAAVPKLSGGKTAGAESTRMDGCDFSKMILRRLRGLETAAQGLAARKPRGFRWTPEGLADFRAVVSSVNSYLKHLDLQLVESVATRRR